jgi:hypothetical protein
LTKEGLAIELGNAKRRLRRLVAVIWLTDTVGMILQRLVVIVLGCRWSAKMGV